MTQGVRPLRFGVVGSRQWVGSYCGGLIRWGHVRMGPLERRAEMPDLDRLELMEVHEKLEHLEDLFRAVLKEVHEKLEHLEDFYKVVQVLLVEALEFTHPVVLNLSLLSEVGLLVVL